MEYAERDHLLGRKGEKHGSVSKIPTTRSVLELATILEAAAVSIRVAQEGGDLATLRLGNASVTAKAVLNLRRKGAEILGEAAIADGPAWDILLDLFINSSHEKPVSVTSAAIGANCPLTTALRWLKILQDHDLVTRVDDPADRRRKFIKLTHKGFEAVVDVLTHYQQLRLLAF